MIERLACRLGRNDETPNIELAEKLCSSMDRKSVCEIADGLKSNDQAVAKDCIKVLYEIGRRRPDLIADFTDDFITALASRDNRIVWGSMMALAFVAPIKPKTIFGRLPEIIAAYERGSVITVDNSISVCAYLCKAGGSYQKRIFPILLAHLANCRAKEIPQHAERIAVCVDSGNKKAFIKAVETRISELTEPQKNRVLKLIKRL